MSLKERLSADNLLDSLPVSRDLLTRLGVLGAQVVDSEPVVRYWLRSRLGLEP